jgi:hypothetical protein
MVAVKFRMEGFEKAGTRRKSAGGLHNAPYRKGEAGLRTVAIAGECRLSDLSAEADIYHQKEGGSARNPARDHHKRQSSFTPSGSSKQAISRSELFRIQRFGFLMIGT